ncbi:phosphotransferase [Streptomyces tubercidicus]
MKCRPAWNGCRWAKSLLSTCCRRPSDSPSSPSPSRLRLPTANSATLDDSVMNGIDGRVPPDAREITAGQANRVWSVDGPTRPYILKHYGDPARAGNEAAVLRLLAMHHAPGPQLLSASRGCTPPWTAQATVHAGPVPVDRFLEELAEPLTAVHSVPGTHVGRSSAPDNTTAGLTTSTTVCACT